MSRRSLLPLLNLLAAVGTVVVNALANIIPYNNRTTGEISDSFPVLFTPAGYVFSIWGIIFIGLLAFGAYQYLPRQRQSRHMQGLGLLFILSCLCNGSWLFAWHYGRLIISIVLMLGLLGSLILIYERLGIGRTRVGRRERWLVQIPFSIYLGWISVATVANVSVVLYAAGWGGSGAAPVVWTAVVLLVASALGCLMSLRKNDLAYNLVLVWAFVGIALKPTTPQLIAGIAIALSAVLLLVWLLSRYVKPHALVTE